MNPLAETILKIQDVLSKNKLRWLFPALLLPLLLCYLLLSKAHEMLPFIYSQF